ATFNPLANNYVIYPNLIGAANGRQVQPGRGYWIKEAAPHPFLSPGIATPSPFNVVLQPGWNMIGDPFPVSLSVDLTQVSVPFAVGGTPANTPMTLQNAKVNHIIDSPFWGYSQPANQYFQTTTLDPFLGYWIH